MPGEKTMSNKFIQLTSGWIPVSVMLLFAAALVMGQDRTGLPQENLLLASPTVPVATPGLLDPNDHVRLESIRMFVDSVLPMPESIEISIGATIRTGKATEPAGESVK